MNTGRAASRRGKNSRLPVANVYLCSNSSRLIHRQFDVIKNPEYQKSQTKPGQKSRIVSAFSVITQNLVTFFKILRVHCTR